MSYNSDFLVTVGTAAPVIALSCILLFSNLVDVASNEHVNNKEATLYNSRITVAQALIYSYFVNGLNLGFQAAMLYAALESLATRKNYWPEEVGVGIEAIAIILLLISTLFVAVAKLGLKKYEDRLPVRRSTLVIRPHGANRKIKSNGYRHRSATKRLTTKADDNDMRHAPIGRVVRKARFQGERR
jgi:hypothetical protein